MAKSKFRGGLILRKNNNFFGEINMDGNKFKLSLIIALTILLWTIFIWPTPYRYEKLRLPIGANLYRDYFYKVNRFTGSATQILPIREPERSREQSRKEEQASSLSDLLREIES